MAEQRRGLLRLAVLQELRVSYGIKVKSGACLAAAKQPAAAAEVRDVTWRQSREGLAAAARCHLGPLPARQARSRGQRGAEGRLAAVVAVPAGACASEALLRAAGLFSSTAGSIASFTLASLAVKVKS